MPEQIIIRKYVSSDQNSILEMLRLNTPAYFAPEEKNDLINYLDNHSENYFVVEYGNAIVCCGGYNYSDEKNVIRISWDMVDPQYQGMGFGSRLTEFRIELIKQIPNIKRISVRTSQLAYQYYARFGFVLEEVVKDFWAPGFDMYRMEMKL
jgi:ribosomal-protein-alanine N-acetyltransferase